MCNVTLWHVLVITVATEMRQSILFSIVVEVQNILYCYCFLSSPNGLILQAQRERSYGNSVTISCIHVFRPSCNVPNISVQF
jgi:hypothetical protein